MLQQVVKDNKDDIIKVNDLISIDENPNKNTTEKDDSHFEILD
jgi:hypothetical protein